MDFAAGSPTFFFFGLGEAARPGVATTRPGPGERERDARGGIDKLIVGAHWQDFVGRDSSSAGRLL